MATVPYVRSYVYNGGAGPPVAAPARAPLGRFRGPGTFASKWGTMLDVDWRCGTCYARVPRSANA